VNFNDVAGLRRTIASVLEQSSKSFEYIVIDGASSDGSVDVIKELQEGIDHWISEPDAGIYQAMNKGIKKSNGDYCLFLNSGDWLVSKNVVAVVIKELESGFDIYYANALSTNGTTHHELRYPHSIDVNYFISSTINHQNALIKTALLKRCGMYREDFKINSDWFFFMKAAYLEKATFKFIEINIAYYYHEGRSNSVQYRQIVKQEHEVGIRELFGQIAPSLLDLDNFRKSVYGTTVERFGSSPLLQLMLRAYRFLARHLRGLRTK